MTSKQFAETVLTLGESLRRLNNARRGYEMRNPSISVKVLLQRIAEEQVEIFDHEGEIHIKWKHNE